MAEKWYIWRGPPTTIEVWNLQADLDLPAIFVFSASVQSGTRLPQALPEDHHQVEGWRAFGLVEEVPAPPPEGDLPQAALPTETRKKERTHG